MDQPTNRHALLFGFGLWMFGVAASYLKIELSNLIIYPLLIAGGMVTVHGALGLARGAGIYLWRVPLRSAVQSLYNHTRQGDAMSFPTPEGNLSFQALYLRLDAAEGHVLIRGKRLPSTKRTVVPLTDLKTGNFDEGLELLICSQNGAVWSNLDISRWGILYHYIRLKRGWTEGQKPGPSEPIENMSHR